MSDPIEVVALDGDDTLWHSETLFVDTQDRFRALLRPYVELDDDDVDAALLEVERDNLPVFGYGVKAFTLSLIETAIRLTDGRIDGAAVQAIVDLGRVLPADTRRVSREERRTGIERRRRAVQLRYRY